MRHQAVVFDLDGTLLDTLTDIADAANEALSQLGLPQRPREDYRWFVGEGVRVLFRRALPPGAREDERLIDRCAAAFREAYGRTWNVHTRPYPGIPTLLDGLTERGVKMAVLSNKPEAFTRQCVDHYLAAYRFEAVLGQREDRPRKPDPAGALEIARRLKLAPTAFLYLGDTAIDMQTARAAGMGAVGALWGFRSREELLEGGAQALAARPEDVLDIAAL